MTKRERRYHQQKKLLRALDRFGASLERYLERHQPVPKYPPGTVQYRFPAIVGHSDSQRDVLHPGAFSIGLNVEQLPKHLFEDHPPVQVWAVDKENNIFPVSIGQMLQTLDYWAQNKEP